MVFGPKIGQQHADLHIFKIEQQTKKKKIVIKLIIFCWIELIKEYCIGLINEFN